MPKPGVAAQLYTVRDLAVKDFAGTVRQVAAIGYRAVELAGYGNLRSAHEARKVLDDHGLRVTSSHAGLEAMEKHLDRILDDQEALGSPTLVCTGLPENRRKSAADWRIAADGFTKTAEACRKRGRNFAYHNHSFEFQRFDGRTGFDLLWDATDPALVRSELDTYWVHHGGADVVSTLDRLGPRVLLLHLKDMAPGPERRFAPVGTGVLNFPAILAAAERAGVEWGIVEQDTTYGLPTLDSLRTSFENLKKIGAV